ncbi:hypothetical protein [Micromonospora sp. NBC_00421]|uniref:hypothetical protein n=1 Tax=Micromonospora sp. NBC_00421 TaxID=2975976 RepID=UPI002E1D6F9D
MSTYPYTDAEREKLQAVKDFNERHNTGGWVAHKSGHRTEYRQTTGKAIILDSGPFMRAVVWLDGDDRAVDLADVTVIPAQPDGLNEHYEDDSDLPDPVKAAERVRDYITANGDGIYDVLDGHPLYARDLEAICRAVLSKAEVAA